MPSLVRKFLRTKAVWSAAAVAGALSALLVAGYMVMESFTLSPTQRADAALGRFDASFDLGGVPVRADASFAELGVAAARDAGATEATLVLGSFDIAPAVTDPPFVAYRETQWQPEPFPDRYSLLEGRWPAAPGEVVLTSQLDPFVADGALEVLSGAANLDVVGVVGDRQAERTATVLAAPGTWAALDWEQISAGQPTVSASATVLWSGGGVDDVAAAIAPLVIAGLGDDELPGATEQLLATSLTVRADIVAGPSPGVVDLYPIAFTVPSVLLPALAAWVALALAARASRRSVATLRAVGLRVRDAVVGRAGASVVALTLSTIAGCLLGVGVGLGLRPVADVASGQPLGPIPQPLGPVLRILTVVLLAAAVGVVFLVRQFSRESTWSLGALLPSPRAMSFARQVVLTVTVVVLFWQAMSVKQLFDVLPIIGTAALAAALAGPSVVRRVVAALPERTAPARLARRRMVHDQPRIAISTVLVAVTVGPAFALLALLASALDAQADLRLSGVPEGQVLLESSSLFDPPPPAVVDLVTSSVDPDARRVDLHATGSGAAYLASESDGLGIVYAVDDPSGAALLCGAGFDDDARSVLESGGVVRLSGPGAAATRPLWAVDPATGASTATVPLTGALVDCGENWATTGATLVLTSTVESLDFDTPLSAVVLVGVTAEDAVAAEEALLAGGWDTAYLEAHADPGAPPLPPEILAVIGVVCGLGVLAVLMTSRAQVRLMRGYAARLAAVGVPRDWSRRVYGRQAATVVAVGTGLATLVAAVPIGIALVRVDADVVVPWATAAALVGAMCVAAALPVGGLTSRLTAAERVGAA